jgi:cystathionine beta-synthase
MSEAHTYKIEGVGEDFIPTATDFSMIDRVISCNDRDGLTFTRRLAREEAIFVGGSSGMAAWVAVEVARNLTPEDLVVVLLPDTGERYLTKVHSDEWMRDNHLLDPAATRVHEMMGTKRRAVPRLLSVQADEPVRKALHLVEQHDITQIPVFRGRELVGTIYDNELLKRVLEHSSVLDQPVSALMSDPLPVISSNEPVSQVTKLLASRTPAVLVRDGEVINGILTRFDMLQFIAEND